MVNTFSLKCFLRVGKERRSSALSGNVGTSNVPVKTQNVPHLHTYVLMYVPLLVEKCEYQKLPDPLYTLFIWLEAT